MSTFDKETVKRIAEKIYVEWVNEHVRELVRVGAPEPKEGVPAFVRARMREFALAAIDRAILFERVLRESEDAGWRVTDEYSEWKTEPKP